MQGNIPLMFAWAWCQAIAVESSSGIVLVYAIQSFKEKDKLKGWLYLILASLLSLVGSVMLYTQFLSNMTGSSEVGSVNSVSWYVVGMSVLRSIVSIGYIVLCRTKHIRFTDLVVSEQVVETQVQTTITIEEVKKVVQEIIQTTTVVEQAQLPAPDNYQRVKEYLELYPESKVREVSESLQMSISSAHKWMTKVRGETVKS